MRAGWLLPGCGQGSTHGLLDDVEAPLLHLEGGHLLHDLLQQDVLLVAVAFDRQLQATDTDRLGRDFLLASPHRWHADHPSLFSTPKVTQGSPHLWTRWATACTPAPLPRLQGQSKPNLPDDRAPQPGTQFSGFQRRKPRARAPRVSTAAQKTSLLTGRNLQRDREPPC